MKFWYYLTHIVLILNYKRYYMLQKVSLINLPNYLTIPAITTSPNIHRQHLSLL